MVGLGCVITRVDASRHKARRFGRVCGLLLTSRSPRSVVTMNISSSPPRALSAQQRRSGPKKSLEPIIYLVFVHVYSFESGWLCGTGGGGGLRSLYALLRWSNPILKKKSVAPPLDVFCLLFVVCFLPSARFCSKETKAGLTGSDCDAWVSCLAKSTPL